MSRGLYGLLESTAADPALSDRCALLHGDETTSYAELRHEVLRCAHLLQKLGVGAGDRVGAMLRNGPDYLRLYYAAAACGAVLVPLNTRLTRSEVDAILSDAGPKVAVCEAEFGELVAGDNRRCVELQSEEWRAPPAVDASFCAAPRSDEDVAQIYYTSGTTGTAKGVMLTHGNVLRHAEMAVHELALSRDDVWGHIAPMFHLADAWATFAITQVGGVHSFVPEFSAMAALDTIESAGVTISNLVPTMLTRMVAAASPQDTSSLRAILSGGAPIAPETVGAIVKRFDCEYVQTYGMTETSPFLTMSLLDDALRALPQEEQMRYRAKTGRAVRGVALRVVDGSGTAVLADDQSVGEIQVRGATVTPGYWNRPDATAEAFTTDGYLCTGDLATIDARGFVTIVDRKKDVILTGGETVYSTEVENRLFAHPAVLEAAVVGLPDPAWGEAVTAFVVLQGPAPQDCTEDSLIAFCREALAGFKTPKAVHFIDELPRTGSGKITKRALRRPG